MTELLRDEEYGHLVGIEQRPIPTIEPQEYPKTKFRLFEEDVDGKKVQHLHTVVVDNPDEEAGLESGWCDTRNEVTEGTDLHGKRIHEHVKLKHEVIEGYEDKAVYHPGPHHHKNPVGYYDHDHHRTDQENLYTRDQRTRTLDATKTGPFENMGDRTVLPGDKPHEATEFGPGGVLKGDIKPEEFTERTEGYKADADHPFKVEPQDRAPDPILPNTAPKQ